MTMLMDYALRYPVLATATDAPRIKLMRRGPRIKLHCSHTPAQLWSRMQHIILTDHHNTRKYYANASHALTLIGTCLQVHHPALSESVEHS